MQVINAGSKNNPSKGLNDRLVLQIIDSGKGINPEDYINAFEPFVRLSQANKLLDDDNPLTDKRINRINSIDTSRSDSASIKRANIESHIESIEGTGLGLSIVKSICEQAGIDVFMKAAHSIDLSRNDNQGLCVTLVF